MKVIIVIDIMWFIGSIWCNFIWNCSWFTGSQELSSFEVQVINTLLSNILYNADWTRLCHPIALGSALPDSIWSAATGPSQHCNASAGPDPCRKFSMLSKYLTSTWKPASLHTTCKLIDCTTSTALNHRGWSNVTHIVAMFHVQQFCLLLNET